MATATKTPAAKPAATPAAAPASTSAKPAPVKKAATKKAAAKKPAAKPAVKKPAVKTAVPKVKAEKPAKAKKPKLVRDSFTIPKAEYLVLEELKQRAAKLQKATKKSEILRAGIKALAALSDAALLTALGNVPAIKTGRPSQS